MAELESWGSEVTKEWTPLTLEEQEAIRLQGEALFSELFAALSAIISTCEVPVKDEPEEAAESTPEGG